MQDIGPGSKLIKALKSHDLFLTEVRMQVEKEEDGIKLDIEDKMKMTNSVGLVHDRLIK